MALTEVNPPFASEPPLPPLDTRSEGTLITRENFEQVLKKEGIID